MQRRGEQPETKKERKTMAWIALSYTLPAGTASRHRVSCWRRLKALGAVSAAGSLYLLPARGDHREALDWLAEEIRAAGGEALVLAVPELPRDAVAGLEEQSRAARGEDYAKLAAEADEVARESKSFEARAGGREALARLRRRRAEIAKIDFWGAAEAALAAEALLRLEQAVAEPITPAETIPRLDRAAFRGRRWVTRPRPFVDRLASAWLIRRFIDPTAEIVYRDEARAGEVPFDMAGAELGHRGERCTFETLLAAFELGGDPALAALAEIVRALDLPGQPSTRQETAGVEAFLRGGLRIHREDAELEQFGMALFESLYAALSEG